MKIIHTSDWHLGRSFGPISLRGDQETFCDFFVDLVIDEAADLVVIAGDLYDRAVAPTEAIGLFRDTIGRLLATGCVVAAITGNHDGADRVAPYSELLDQSRFYLRGGYDRVGSVVTHSFDDGPLDIVLLPYLHPQAAPDAYGLSTGDDGEVVPAGSEDGAGPDLPAGSDGGAGEAVGAGGTVEPVPAGTVDVGEPDDRVARRLARTHQSVLEVAADTARARCTSPRSIAVSHAFVTGGVESDSEQALTVGGTGAVDASVFDGFSAVLLGHLHRPQSIGGDGRIAYSGTPLAYSFSEDHPKSVRIVELDPTGASSVRTEGVPVGRPVRTLRGTMAELLDPDAHPDASGAFVRAIVTDRETVLDARSRLAPVYPSIAEIRLEPEGGPAPGDATAAPAVTARQAPIDAVRAFWEVAEGSPPDDATDALLVGATSRAMVTEASS